MLDIDKAIRDKARELLEQKRVNLVIGYEAGTLPLRSRPCFITAPEEAARLIWDATCANNLAVYLPPLFRAVKRSRKKDKSLKVGIVAKGCDARSLVGHLKEKQVRREDLYIIGVPCGGTIDRDKVSLAVQDREITTAEIKEGTVTVAGAGFSRDLKVTDCLRECCLSCGRNNPVLCDVLAGKEAVLEIKKDPHEQVARIERLPTGEKWQDFEAEISKCIRCYACRNACPLCYCTTCFVEQSLPRWIGITDNLSDTSFFQLIRIYHTAGRCVDCGACVSACPMGVDLRKYTQKLNQDVRELFDYAIGEDPDSPPALQTFKTDDPQKFILEPK